MLSKGVVKIKDKNAKTRKKLKKFSLFQEVGGGGGRITQMAFSGLSGATGAKRGGGKGGFFRFGGSYSNFKVSMVFLPLCTLCWVFCEDGWYS
jgi:hypothetical protein